MTAIDITSILGPDLKSRVAVNDVLTYLSNTGSSQTKEKQMESAGEVTYCTSLEELNQCLAYLSSTKLQ